MEELKNQIKIFSQKINSLEENISNEEQTKTALIMPFFAMLGYDVFNPMEFVPEYTADVGIKKGEKVDYAIILNNEPVILIEAKSIGEDLKNHDSQLFRYFATTTAKFGILTNGREYKFYTDLDQKNKMDLTPFLSFDILNIKEHQIKSLAKFKKDNFDVDNILNNAEELKYIDILKSYLLNLNNTMSNDFISFVMKDVFQVNRTSKNIEMFTPIIQKAYHQFINDSVNDKLTAMVNDAGHSDSVIENEEPVKNNKKDNIITTNTELEVYGMIKIMLSDIIDSDRIYYRDNNSYFNILIDDKITKWVLRFYEKSDGMSIMLNDNKKDSLRTKIKLDKITDIGKEKDKIVDIVNQLK